MVLRPPSVPGPPHSRRTTVSRTPLDEWWARRRALFLTIHNNHNSRIRTRNLIRRAASDLRLRPRGHWDRLILQIRISKITALKVLRPCPLVLLVKAAGSNVQRLEVKKVRWLAVHCWGQTAGGEGRNLDETLCWRCQLHSWSCT